MIEVCCGLDYNGGRSGGEWSLRNGIGREDGVNMSNMSRGRKKLIKAMISR
jgi:hypothetical protein